MRCHGSFVPLEAPPFQFSIQSLLRDCDVRPLIGRDPQQFRVRQRGVVRSEGGFLDRHGVSRLLAADGGSAIGFALATRMSHGRSPRCAEVGKTLRVVCSASQARCQCELKRGLPVISTNPANGGVIVFRNGQPTGQPAVRNILYEEHSLANRGGGAAGHRSRGPGEWGQTLRNRRFWRRGRRQDDEHQSHPVVDRQGGEGGRRHGGGVRRDLSHRRPVLQTGSESAHREGWHAEGVRRAERLSAGATRGGKASSRRGPRRC